MATRNTRAAAPQAAPTRRRRPAPEPVAEAPVRQRRQRPAPEPVEESTGRNVTVYATKEPTPFHKAFAKWIVTEVGYRPSQAESLKAAFLAGVSIATAARPAFNDSEWLETWREENGVVKRGRKRADEVTEEPVAEAPKRRRKPEPEPEAEDDDDFDEADEADDVDDDDDFDDDESDEDDSDFDDDDDDDEPEPEPTPAPVKRGPGRPRKATTAVAPAKAQPTVRVRAAQVAKAAPAKATSRRAKPTADDDFAF